MNIFDHAQISKFLRYNLTFDHGQKNYRAVFKKYWALSKHFEPSWNIFEQAVTSRWNRHKSTKYYYSFEFSRTFKVGQGCSVDLDLASYGYCQYVSQFHASIFFDQYSRIFELINYRWVIILQYRNISIPKYFNTKIWQYQNISI